MELLPILHTISLRQAADQLPAAEAAQRGGETAAAGRGQGLAPPAGALRTYPDKYPSIFPVAASLSGVCVWRSPHACMHTSVPHVSHLTRQKKDRNLTGAAEGGREESVEVAQACSLARLAFQSDARKVVWPFSHGRRPSQSVIPLSGVTITVQWGGRATDGLATYLLPSPDRR